MGSAPGLSLDRLRASFLAHAAAEAEHTVAAAAAERARRLDDARDAASRLVAEGRRTGEAAAGAETARTLLEARRRTRASLLAVRRELYDELRERALEQASALLDDAAFLTRLEGSARAQLGPAATTDAAAAGGIVACAGGRRVDYSLPALVDRCVAALGERVEELWR